MAYPPAIPQPNITNATAQGDRHPTEHNATNDALEAIVTELGTNPKGDAASLTARLAGFTSVDGVIRDANAAWGVQKWEASQNGGPAQYVPSGVETDVTAAGFAPMTVTLKAGRLYRLEGLLAIQGQDNNQQYIWSLYRDGTKVIQGQVGPMGYSVVTHVPIMVYQRVNGADVSAGNHTYKYTIQALYTPAEGKVMHPCVMALTDVGPDLPGAGPAGLAADFTFDMDPPE